MVTFEIKGGLSRGRKFLEAVEMLSFSANLGDTRTTITHPASTTHSKLNAEDKMAVGISDGLIRISVGLENINDIMDDIEQAFEKTR